MMTSESEQNRRELRSFGRRSGRKLSTRQQNLLDTLLPRVGLDVSNPPPVRLAELFAGPVETFALEIGFGGAEHLIWQAERHPDTGFIGCEPFIDGVVKALTAIDQRKLTNIRLYANDARDVLRWLPRACIDRAYVLFPDPWPKTRHRKRRLVNAESLAMLAKVMHPGTSRLRVATDIGDYARTLLIAYQHSGQFRWLVDEPGDWRKRPNDWPATRYEQKAVREGRRSYFFAFERTQD